MRGRAHMIKGSVKCLIPKGTKKTLKGSNTIKISLLIYHPKYNIEIDNKGQEEMWGDQVKSHFKSGLEREDGSLDWDWKWRWKG